MARHSRTPFAVLGMLAHGEKSGYDLKKHFERSVGNFWSESIGQIYPTLRTLEQRGWARSTRIAQDRRPDRTVYAITKRGREALADWLAKPCERDHRRNELLLKTYLGTEVAPAQALAHIERYEAELRESLAIFQTYKPQIRASASGPEQEMYWSLCLESGLLVTKGRLQWCKRARVRIREFFGDAVEDASTVEGGATS